MARRAALNDSQHCALTQKKTKARSRFPAVNPASSTFNSAWVVSMKLSPLPAPGIHTAPGSVSCPSPAATSMSTGGGDDCVISMRSAVRITFPSGIRVGVGAE
jgi:hypothetical protein